MLPNLQLLFFAHWLVWPLALVRLIFPISLITEACDQRSSSPIQLADFSTIYNTQYMTDQQKNYSSKITGTQGEKHTYQSQKKV